MSFTLILGATGKIGEKLSIRLAKEKHKLLLHYATQKRKAEALLASCRDLGASCELFQADFSKKTEISHFLAEIEKGSYQITKLISTVGNYSVGSPSSTTDEIFEGIFAVNFFSHIRIIRELLPNLSRNQAKVVLMGVAGLNRQCAESYATAYSASKYSLLHVMRALAKEHVSNGLTFNMVSPGYVEGSIDLPSSFSGVLHNRPVEVDEILDAICYLSSSAANMITGQNIDVAGGVRL